MVCGVCSNLEFNDITTISLGAFEGLGVLRELCAQRWCGENGAVWDMELCGCGCLWVFVELGLPWIVAVVSVVASLIHFVVHV